MRFHAAPLPLRLTTPFRVAHGTSTVRENLLVRLDGGEASGLGEGAVVPYYPYTLEALRAYVDALDAEALLGKPFALEDALDRLPPGPPPVRAAVDLALHDYWGRTLGQPLYRLWGLNPARAPETSFTIAITEDEDELRERVRAAAAFTILKLKLGSGEPERDEATVRIAREETEARLCVDANSGWDVDTAARLIPRLATHDLLFVEQPLPTGDVGAWGRLRERLPADAPPLIADESVQGVDDVLALAGVVDGVNVKLAKAGGLREARRLVTLARALGLRVMLGCMVESAVAVTAAAHLAPLADYADLDAPLLVADDPFRGVTLDGGRLHLPEGPGLGVTPTTLAG